MTLTQIGQGRATAADTACVLGASPSAQWSIARENAAVWHFVILGCHEKSTRNQSVRLIRTSEGRVCCKVRILSGIQFTRYFIKFAFVKMNQSVDCNSKLILTRQPCGQRSSMDPGSKH